MSEYIIFTDSGSDIGIETLEQWGVSCLSLTFRFDGSEEEHTNASMPADKFYAQMREGKSAKTAAVNMETFKEAFEAELKKGNDVLYLGFSGGLSSTSSSGHLAANELQEIYPDRKIIAIDTLQASAGQGLIVYLAVEKKKQGASIDECAAYVREISPRTSAWFTVDDLVYLKRGGRVSPAVALIGSMLNIKPVMHVDDEGHLVKVSQARGRKAALKAMATKYTETALDPKAGPIFISHGDCIDDANRLADMIKAEHGVDTEMIVYVGPVIGSHSGPGTLALFFQSKER